MNGLKFLGVLVVMVGVVVYGCGGEQVEEENGEGSSGVRVYKGSASIGDIVVFSVNDDTHTLSYSNLTRNISWSTTYSDEPDGSKKFTLGLGSETKDFYFIEYPERVLVVAFEIDDVPAMAVLVPNQINSESDVSKLSGTYFEVGLSRDDESGGYELSPGRVKVDNSTAYVYKLSNDALVEDSTASLSYSNGFGFYAVSSDDPSKKVAIMARSGDIYLADFGEDNGFAVGVATPETEPSVSELNGLYNMIIIWQEREEGSTNIISEVERAQIKVSNGVVFMSTNGTDWDEVDAVTNDVVAYDGFTNYIFVGTNDSDSDPMHVLPSKDLKILVLGNSSGSPEDTNSYYSINFGFCLKQE